jgi:hypothetical protein
MKKTILIGLFCSAVVGAAAILRKDKVIIEKIIVTQLNNKKESPQILVKVTLTKYQLRKMLDILEEYHTVRYWHDGTVAPNLAVAPADAYTFTSVAKENKQSGEYTLSSTHLSRK